MSTDIHDDTALSEVVSFYLDSRSDEVSTHTLSSHQYRLRHLVRWADEKNVESVEQLNPRLLYEYKQWRKRDGDLNQVSLHTQMSTVRVFVKWCGKMQFVDENLYDAVDVPTLDDGEDQRNVKLKEEDAEKILRYLSKYEYASIDHVIIRLLWRVGMRIGAIHSIDVDDYYPQKRTLKLVHRPEGGTSLKKKYNGERTVAINRRTCEVLNDYIETHRNDVQDNHDRKPLLTTNESNGRLSKSSIRRIVYRCTQPCLWMNRCPHNRTIDECEDEGYKGTNGCLSSVNPHAIRRGAITRFLSDNTPVKAIEDRADVTSDVLDKHYDARTEDEKAENRREFFEDE